MAKKMINEFHSEEIAKMNAEQTEALVAYGADLYTQGHTEGFGKGFGLAVGIWAASFAIGYAIGMVKLVRGKKV